MKKVMIRVITILTVFWALLTPETVKAESLTAKGGVNYFGEQKETWYNLPMDRIYEKADQRFGSHHKRWTRSDGCKMYGPFIMCAANWQEHPYGSLVESSLGTCIVLDTGAFATPENLKQIDIATNW